MPAGDNPESGFAARPPAAYLGPASARHVPRNRLGGEPPPPRSAIASRACKRLAQPSDLFIKMRIFGLLHPGNRIQRQAETHGRIARNQIHPLGTERPGAADPSACPVRSSRGATAARIRYSSSPCSNTRASRARSSSFSNLLSKIDVYRKPPLLPHVVPSVLVRGERVVRIDVQSIGECRNETRARGRAGVPRSFSAITSAESRQTGSPSLRQ